MRDRITVDSIAFARDADELQGTLAVAELSRLHDVLFDQSGVITYRLTGAMNKDGIATLALHIEATLVLICQRCLGPMKFGLDATRNFELVPESHALGDPAEEPGDVERIHADAKLDVAVLVEEEAILCLPMKAAHPAGECLTPPTSGGGNEIKSAFSALAALKRP
ncbi:MAG: YceD family protein [Betaproteobacteria bacterium]